MNLIKKISNWLFPDYSLELLKILREEFGDYGEIYHNRESILKALDVLIESREEKRK